MRRASCLLTVVVLLAITGVVAPARACLWDEDTLKDEQRGLPDVASVLAGKWERHSAFFYQRRVDAMTERLAADATDLAAYDNLAVAHEKLGDVTQAIAVMLRKEGVRPGEYTTHANLGTFYLHAGDLDRGIEQIEAALRINPDAHFGREKYQLQVAQYLRAAKADPKVLDGGSFVMPILLEGSPATQRATTNPDEVIGELPFAIQMRRVGNTPKIEEAITGVVGMIRFGTGTSSHLYLALGDLLAARGDPHLAYRAYRRARDFDHPRPELVAERMSAMRMRVEHASGFDDALIDRERADAAAWVAKYQAHEDALLKAGRDPSDEAALASFYREHGSPRDPPSAAAAWWARATTNRLTGARGAETAATLGLAAVGAAVLAAIVRRRRRRSATVT